MKKEEMIIDKIKKQLLKREEIIFAYLFGSFLENEQYNDIAVGIYIRGGIINEEASFDYSISLSGELSYNLGIDVDLKIINFLPLGVIKNILQGHLLFTRDRLFLEEYTEEKSFEYMEYFELSKEYLKGVLSDQY